MIHDLHLATRLLRKNPGFTLACILALALGIGANTAIFSMVNGILLRPLDFKKPEELVWIWSTRTDRDKAFFSIPDFIDYREQNSSLQQMAAFANWGANLTEGSNPERLAGIRVTAHAFEMLGVTAISGRCLQAEDGRPGSARTVVVSHALWQKRFASDPGIIGKSLTLNSDNYTVIGVLPPSFAIPNAELDVATPLILETDPRRSDRGANFLRVFARMKPGVTTRQVQSEMDSISRNLQSLYPKDNAKKTPPKVFLLQNELVGNYHTSLLILLGAVGLVLLIACSNLANLLLSRASMRSREMAVRTALGASRGHLIRQLLTETGLLALIGGCFGLFVAWNGLKFLVALSPENLPRAHEIHIDGSVLGFTLLISCMAGLIFGLVPALQTSKVDLTRELNGAGKGAVAGGQHDMIHSVLVVSEIALSLILLITAALLMKSFRHLQEVKPGFTSENLLLARLSLPAAKYSSRAAVTGFFDKVLPQIQTVPGVRSAGASNVLPLSGMNTRADFTISGRPPISPTDKPAGQSRWVTPDYFQTLGIRLVKGRQFTGHDNATAAPVAIIDEALARRHWPDSNPIGAHLLVEDTEKPRDVEIVGVVESVKHFSLDEEATPTFYAPMDQMPDGQVSFVAGNCSLAIRTNQSPLPLENQIRREVSNVDNEVPFSSPRTMEQVLSTATASRRFNVLLLSIFSGLAVLLAVTGVYAVISYSVTRRQREIGIRMALGAQSSDVIKMVLNHGIKLVAIGVSLGLLGGLFSTRLISSLLFGVNAIDPAIFVLASLVLAIIAIGATYMPARRASKVDPAVALRAV